MLGCHFHVREPFSDATLRDGQYKRGEEQVSPENLSPRVTTTRCCGNQSLVHSVVERILRELIPADSEQRVIFKHSYSAAHAMTRSPAEASPDEPRNHRVGAREDE